MHVVPRATPGRGVDRGWGYAVTQQCYAPWMPLADGMMKAAHQFIAGVQQIEGLEVVGEPEMTVVAFKATRAAAKQ